MARQEEQELNPQEKQQQMVDKQNKQRLKVFSMEIAVKNSEGRNYDSKDLIAEAQEIFDYMTL